MNEPFNPVVIAEINLRAAQATRDLERAQAVRRGMNYSATGASAQGRKVAELRSQADSWAEVADYVADLVRVQQARRDA